MLGVVEAQPHNFCFSLESINVHVHVPFKKSRLHVELVCDTWGGTNLSV